ncbi:duplicated homeodomain-like superfamily protein [Actinidia rufa]|uniref:Duplicated homeodomain-like superfamily protein n=1 Tax=Actinidia rufa TaxID=165716 RepID=A0A7J0EDY0_9ERIC|nr:duplicated homeodomain-like superfamily protein [Actinidia rufa]
MLCAPDNPPRITSCPLHFSLAPLCIYRPPRRDDELMAELNMPPSLTIFSSFLLSLPFFSSSSASLFFLSLKWRLSSLTAFNEGCFWKRNEVRKWQGLGLGLLGLGFFQWASILGFLYWASMGWTQHVDVTALFCEGESPSLDGVGSTR